MGRRQHWRGACRRPFLFGGYAVVPRGRVEVNRTAEWRGLKYDPRLITPEELSDLWSMAHSNPQEPNPARRWASAVRVAERVRSSPAFPAAVEVGYFIRRQKFDEAEACLLEAGLGPPSPDWDELQEARELAKETNARRSEILRNREAQRKLSESRYSSAKKRGKVAGGADLHRFSDPAIQSEWEQHTASGGPIDLHLLDVLLRKDKKKNEDE